MFIGLYILTPIINNAYEKFDQKTDRKKAISLIKYFSSITLDIYLTSNLIDKLIYPIFIDIFNFSAISNQYEIIYAPVIVIIIFILSIIYSSIRKLLIKIK